MRIYDEEDQNIEFKESWNSTELLKWVCGFANAKGSKMYIGVRDDGEVLGLSNSKKLMEDISNAIVSAFGMYDAEVNLLRDGEKKLHRDCYPQKQGRSGLQRCSIYKDRYDTSDHERRFFPSVCSEPRQSFMGCLHG